MGEARGSLLVGNGARREDADYLDGWKHSLGQGEKRLCLGQDDCARNFARRRIPRRGAPVPGSALGQRRSAPFAQTSWVCSCLGKALSCDKGGEVSTRFMVRTSV